MQETSIGVENDVSYIPIYAVQVRLQVGFQVEQDASHLESDLSSPVVSFGPEIFRSGEWSSIS